jgi:Domain of unknown function (DUF4157)
MSGQHARAEKAAAAPASTHALPSRAAAAEHGVSNQALQRQLHPRGAMPLPRFAVGRADDPAEAAANRIAERIVQPGAAPCACGGTCDSCRGDAGVTARQPRSTPNTAAARSEVFASRSGQPLAPNLRTFFEPRLGMPLASVRVHQDVETAATARRIGARAFAAGNDIGFARGEYAPDTRAGRLLLAHELAHVAERDTAAEPLLRRQPAVPGSAPSDPTPPLATRQPTPFDAAVSQSAPPQSIAPDPAPPAPGAPPAAAPATVDPATINARTLTNADLIARDLDARNSLASAVASSPETEAWQRLSREMADERTRRIGLGFIFLAERTDSSPAALYQMRGGAAAGTIEIVTGDFSVAMGAPDVTLTGGIMTPRQMSAYIATLGYRTITGPTATGIIADRAGIIQRAMMAASQSPGTLPTQGGIGRNPFLDVNLAGGHDPYGAGSGPGRLPLDLSGANFRGRVGEIGMGSDYRTGWGTGLQDFNQLPWIDVTGRRQTGNFPVVDFGPGQGGVPRILDIRPISVTSSGAEDYATRRQQYIMKIEALLDVEGRRATAPAGGDMVLQHLRQSGGDATLAAGTPAFQQAQARYLPDTMFAVPDANVAALRNAIAHPNAAPAGGTNRLIARGGGMRDLYEEALRSSPIQLTLRKGGTVSCNSLAELAARAPVASSFTVSGSSVTYPPDQRISTAEFSRAMDVLGQTAASRIVSISNAPAMAAAADAARAPTGGGPTVSAQTRILEIDSPDLSYIGERIGQGLADPRSAGAPGSGGTRWTTAAEADPMLSAVRAMTGNPTLQRGTPEFEAARSQALGNAMLAINADDVTAFRGTLSGEDAWKGRLRASFGAAMADNPVTVTDAGGVAHVFHSPEELDAARGTLPPEQYNQARAQAQGLVTSRVTGSGVTTTELTRLEGFRDKATGALGDEAHTVLQSDVLSHVRLGSPRATAESFGRGGLGGLIIGVVTTAGTMYIDEREHPDWAQELAAAGGRNFAVSGTQSAVESRLTYYMAQRAIASGTPLSGFARFGARAGPAALFAGGMELYDISQEHREHSGVEVVTRTGRAMGIAVLSMEIGAAAGSIVPGAGTAAGAVVGFLVGAAAGVISAYILENAIPGGAEDWNAEAAAADRRRAAQAEALRQAMAPRVVGGFGATTTVTPVMSSPDITEQEQAAIAQWATLLTMARREPPRDATQGP